MDYKYSKVANLEKLQNELTAAGIPVQSVQLDGDSDLTIKTTGDLSSDDALILYNTVSAHTPEAVLTQKEKDLLRFSRRAAAKDGIIANMAADNMERVRNGTWTTLQLISLTSDVQLKEILSDISALSFEIAYAKIDGIANPLVTPTIKSEWKMKLYSCFYSS